MGLSKALHMIKKNSFVINFESKERKLKALAEGTLILTNTLSFLKNGPQGLNLTMLIILKSLFELSFLNCFVPFGMMGVLSKMIVNQENPFS